LQTTQRYFLKKEDRLKSRKAIDLLFTKGKSFSNFPFRICWQLVDDEIGLKAGFTASSKNFKKATDRNRIKRLIREAYRLQKKNLQEAIKQKNKGLHLFFIYTGKEVPDYEFIFEKTGTVLKRIIKLIDEVVE
jgi:ribonuclease P protein component